MGLVQREIEAAGISTITLSPVADFTASVGAPRVAAIEHPLGQMFGQPDDRKGQLAVLRATLNALVEMEEPGTIHHLPFEWPQPPNRVRSHPHPPPPIAQLLRKRPLLYRKLVAGEIPGNSGN